MANPLSVIVHPLVLLSAVDHYTRLYGIPSSSLIDDISKNMKNRKRAVGILLGSYSSSGASKNTVVNVASSYAVPFEEDEKNPDVWFLDHNFHESMFALCRKVSAKERVVGWYHTGPALYPSDIKIHSSIISKYASNSILLIIDVTPQSDALPVKAYGTVDDPSSFSHISCTIGSEEAEEIGVAHLLRDVNVEKKMPIHPQCAFVSKPEDTQIEPMVGNLSFPALSILPRVEAELVPLALRHSKFIDSLKSLVEIITLIISYLEKISCKEVFKINPKINELLQDVVHYLPSFDKNDAVSNSLTQISNDRSAMDYIAMVTKTLISIHSLIDNKKSIKST